MSAVSSSGWAHRTRPPGPISPLPRVTPTANMRKATTTAMLRTTTTMAATAVTTTTEVEGGGGGTPPRPRRCTAWTRPSAPAGRSSERRPSGPRLGRGEKAWALWRGERRLPARASVAPPARPPLSCARLWAQGPGGVGGHCPGRTLRETGRVFWKALGPPRNRKEPRDKKKQLCEKSRER